MGGLAARRKGGHWANQVANWFSSHGYHVVPTMQRVDAEDLILSEMPWLSIEAKNHKAMSLASWVDQAERQAAARGADVAVVVHHRTGKAAVTDAYVTMTGAAFAELLRRIT